MSSRKLNLFTIIVKHKITCVAAYDTEQAHRLYSKFYGFMPGYNINNWVEVKQVYYFGAPEVLGTVFY